MCGPGPRPRSGRRERAQLTQEVRDFAAKQNTDTFLAATQNPPRNGEGDHSPLPANGGGAAALAAEDLSAEASAQAEAGMAEMSEKFREQGGEIYLPAK
jgi:phosphomethylpyrimidine synthase